MTAELEALLRARLRLRGRTLESRLRRAGRLLPRRARRAGQVVTTAQTYMQHPGLARLIDPAALDTAHATLRDHLRGIDPKERRKTALLRWAAGLVINLALLGVLVTLLLRWLGPA